MEEAPVGAAVDPVSATGELAATGPAVRHGVSPLLIPGWLLAGLRDFMRAPVPSLLVGLRARAAGRRIEDNAWFDQQEFAAHGGSFPIYLRGTGVVGTVTVSGLPQKADHELVVEALSEILGRSER